MSTEANGSRRGPLGLNINSGISIGLACLIVAAALWVRDGQTKTKEDVLALADARYASREALDSKYATLNELVNARVTILTERLSALSSAVGDLRTSTSTLPDVLAAVRDIQRQLDRIEKERK